RAWGIAARGQSRIRPFTHRRHRADDRAGSAWPAAIAYRARRQAGSDESDPALVRSVGKLADHRFDCGAIGQEGVDARRIEMPAALRLEEVDALVEVPRTLVRTLRYQRVEHVGDGDDARNERNIFAVQAVRIAGTVELLV